LNARLAAGRYSSASEYVREEMGAALASTRPEFSALRKSRIRDFDNFLIFYEPRPERRLPVNIAAYHYRGMSK
jgi:Arc/MetJ-type ribon-helix-helix transcriptional regulator